MARSSRAAWIWTAAVLTAGLGTSGPARAQVTLADDIIMAAKMEGEEQRRESELGRMPGTAESLFKRTPGSSDLVVGNAPNRRMAPLPRLTRRPAHRGRPAPAPPPLEREHGLASSIEGLGPLRAGAPPGAAGEDSDENIGPELFLDEGPPDGMTLDAAIERLLQSSQELRTKYFEIPQARADILTAGLRANPLFFYSTDGIPYGKGYSENRPGEIEHGISLVYPIDFSGKRRARVGVARAQQQVMEAQYQDEVRLAIDELYTAFVDALAARLAVRAAEHGLAVMDREARMLREAPAPLGSVSEAVDDLIIERDIEAMSVGDERDRYDKAIHRLATLLDLTPQETESLTPRGSLRPTNLPSLPPLPDLVGMALRRRPDLVAHRRGIALAHAELSSERA